MNHDITPMFKALAHPARVEILDLLNRSPMTTGELCDKFQVWNKTLKSLKDYVDTGMGNPHVPKSGISGLIARTAFKTFSRQYTK